MRYKFLFLLIFIEFAMGLFAVYHKLNDIQLNNVNYFDIEIKDNFAFFSDNDYGLMIYDISEYSNPVPISSIELEYPICEILLSENIIYIITIENLIYLVNINNPWSPYIVSQYFTMYPCITIDVNSNYAFISEQLELPNGYINAIEIIDITDVYDPQYVSYFGLTSGAYSIELTEDLAFIGTLTGLHVYDITDIFGSVQVDWLDISNIKGLTLYNGLLYFSSSHEMLVLDFSDPENNRIVSTNSDLRFDDCVILNDYIYGANGNYLHVADISDPSSVNFINSYVNLHSVRRIAFSENKGYFGDINQYINIVELTDPHNPYLFDFYDIKARKIEKSPDNTLLLIYGNKYEGLKFYSTLDPANPEYLYSHISHCGNWDCNGFYIDNEICCSVFQSEDYDYMSLYLYDHSNFNELSLLSITPLDFDSNCGRIEYISRKYEYLYLAKQPEGIIVVDISDQENPDQIMMIPIDGFIIDLTIEDNYMYYVDIGGFHIIDISDPLEFNYISYWESNHGATNFALYGNYAYVADDDGGIKILDISDKVNPVMVDSLLLNNSSRINQDLLVENDLLFITDRGWNEIFVFDLYCPDAPTLTFNYRWDKYTNEMELLDTYLYCAHGVLNTYPKDYPGLSILDLSHVNIPFKKNLPPYHVLTLSNHPNPFNPSTTISYHLPEVSRVSLSIYNIKGQLVRAIVNDIKSAGEHSVIWDGIDDREQPVDSGIYLYQLKAGIEVVSKKMVLLK